MEAIMDASNKVASLRFSPRGSNPGFGIENR
mgnify:CR=1 FL=1